MARQDYGDTEEARERRSRWLELAISIIVAALSGSLTCVATISWFLSGTLSRMQERSEVQGQQLQQLQAAVATIQTLDSAQGAQLAVGDAHYADLIRRMDSFDAKLDKLVLAIKR